MINVLHIIEALGAGGAERRLMHDLKYLDRGLIKHTVCSLSEDLGLWKDELKGIPVHYINIRKAGGMLPAVAALNRLVKDNRVDIIHTQVFWADLTGRLLKILNPGVKLVSTIQTSAHDKRDPYLYSYKRKLVDSLSGRICNDGYIAVSEYVRKVCLKQLRFPERKLRVIYNSVDPAEFRFSRPASASRGEFGIKEEQKVLITVGRLDPPKGHVYLLKALAVIKNEFPDIKLLIVGDGPGKNDLFKECSDLNLGGNVIFTGIRSDVPDLLRIADVFVFPTLSEGLPLALLEAMSVGLVSVATSIAPNKEIIDDGKNGLLVECRDPEGISRAVLSVLKDKALKERLKESAACTVKEKFSAENCARKLQDYYVQIMK